ncbi:Predicted ATPase [Quadrisphaera granulorum]|uniref:Putative ATPase n=1 Tax=Quadrisphaera granulorum TaxID=317664 RepID=A0A315ZNW2_9ACTN|nr:ATP-binding protein [Quadrisphaera granulorum]PWJ47271.1 putative ATPase [Quadrisphaera granulorum]SZE98842.1 Predicted ATPase [Quadrisphaera granulorum]
MATASLRRIHLDSFKSFQREHLDLAGVTVLTGRNSAGKSNALDAIEVLARLADGDDLHEALDGRGRDGDGVRGGARGCAPHRENTFSLGCTASVGKDLYRLELTVEVEPVLRIVRESLWGPAPAAESRKVESHWLMVTRPSDQSHPGLSAEIYNGKRGPNPIQQFRDDRLLTLQLAARMNTKHRVEAAVLRGAEAVTSALRGAFHLDPVPHLMRGYVPERDVLLRRTAENVSAAVHRLETDDPAAHAAVTAAVQRVTDRQLRSLVSVVSPLGDVMLGVDEGVSGDEPDITPAREMSDGLLRFLAVATAMRTAGQRLDIDALQSLTGVEPGVLLVVEEIENGLHPAQADHLLELIRGAASPPSTRILITTHSPALLNALTGELNESVVVCYRDAATGHSRLSRAIDLPGYVKALAAGDMGDAISRGQLVAPRTETRDLGALAHLIGRG